jgi:hypothetical protein
MILTQVLIHIKTEFMDPITNKGQGRKTNCEGQEVPFSNRYIKHKLQRPHCPKWLSGEYFRFQN